MAKPGPDSAQVLAFLGITVLCEVQAATKHRNAPQIHFRHLPSHKMPGLMNFCDFVELYSVS